MIALLTAFWLMVLCGCGPVYYKNDADQEVYDILYRKHRVVFDSRERYAIERLAADPLENLDPADSPILELPDGFIRAERPPLIISLAAALEIAVYNNREYQTEKERVYLVALALTGERNAFSAQFSSLLTAFYENTNDDEFLSATSEVGVSRLLETGASIGINLSSEFLRFLTGDPRRTAASILAVSVVQPLWRGAGRQIVTEDLTQAERDVVYSIREFSRFKKAFAVSVASDYFRVLEQRVVVRNEQRNYRTLMRGRSRAEMLARAGRLPEFQVDQAKQDELRAKDRWILALEQYYRQLDRFKLTLGVPADAHVDLDDGDLDRMMGQGIRHPELSRDRAVALALENRQDLKVTRGRVADARRKIAVAENNLYAQIDLVAEGRVPSRSKTRPFDFQPDRTEWLAGLEADLPLERTAERNAYRASLIGLDRANRDLSLKIDEIKLEVRNDWRSLLQARASYDIQKSSVDLARRRVESTSLFLQAGRADTRDVLESQSALVDAENALIRALTDHTVLRLELFRDIGLLSIGSHGMWDPVDISRTDAPDS